MWTIKRNYSTQALYKTVEVTDIVWVELFDPLADRVIVECVQCSLAADWTVSQIAGVHLDVL